MLVGTAVAMAASAGLAAPAAAADPPDRWANERVLNCDGEVVNTYLTPAGFGPPFHVVGSRDVIVPKYVSIYLADGSGPFVTVDVPGFDVDGSAVVHCTYVDPIGLSVEFWGLRK
ncbi:hypothetical protein [Ornithinimicrobium sp. LYQ103]|uniref:hypothetical protein n=1 Tax=Ornithinimicrobium sp. LYQ103 TaxID=3378796 RepID=UPI0038526FC7